MSKDFDDTKNGDLSQSIIEAYGSREGLAEVLNLGIEMLFYLEEDTFERRDVQHVASAIRLVRDFLQKAA
ncbi:MAG: hypothetical protein AAGL34_13890 [Bacteroidota bacterium]